MCFRLILIFTVLVSSFTYAHEDDIPRSLNPAKGITVWQQQPERIVISWPSYGNPTHLKTHIDTLMPDDGTEITVSSFTCSEDYLALLFGLHRYNLSKLHPSCTKEDQVFTVDGSQITGFVGYGESVFVENIQTENIEDILACIERESFSRGGRNVFIQLTDYQKGLGPLFSVNKANGDMAERLQKIGYVCLPGDFDFMTGHYEGGLMKEMTQKPAIIPGSNITLKWEKREHMRTTPKLSECFGVFVRNSLGLPQGGIWGKISKDATYPHAYIETFFMSETIRGSGFGKITMHEVETYVKSHGVNLISLETCEHQAPWFYEDAGFLRTMTIPKILKSRKEGEYFNSYNYCKTLSRVPLITDSSSSSAAGHPV